MHRVFVAALIATCARGADAAPRSRAQACWSAWQKPVAVVAAKTRPATTATALRLTFAYSIKAGRGRVVLERIAADSVVMPSDGPFDTTKNAGSWVELRDRDGKTLHTRTVHALVPEVVEAPHPSGTLTSHARCPTTGAFFLDTLPNDPRATHVVLVQEALDGEPGGRSIELVRFALPTKIGGSATKP
jgi:hypothetical protein